MKALRHFVGPGLALAALSGACGTDSPDRGPENEVGSVVVSADSQAAATAEPSREVRPDREQPSSTASRAPEQRALIIAIGAYGQPAQGAPYRPLNSGNDVALVRSGLKHHGFKDENVLVLRDEAATRDGIVRGFREHLIRDAVPGDIVVFHYSGHGHQLTDDDGDEVDGYDEVLVPFAAPDFSRAPNAEQQAYDGAAHIRDDELGDLIDELRERVGREGSVTVFLDACFSGTGTRGGLEPAVRGSATPIGDPATGGTRGGGDAARGSGVIEGAGNFVVISAASHRQLAWETTAADGETSVGSLSYALSQALPRIRSGDSYRTLFTYVNQALEGRLLPQTPQIEGEQDLTVFGNHLAVGEWFAEVDSLAAGDGTVFLNAGALHGLGEGAVVEFYAVGTLSPDSAQPIASGTITDADPMAAAVAVDGSPGSELDLRHTWVFPLRSAYGDLAIRARISPELSAEVRADLRSRLSTQWIVQVVDERPDVSIEPAGRGIQARAVPSGTVIGEPTRTASGRSVAGLVDRVAGYGRNVYLRRIPVDHPTIDVSLTLRLAEHTIIEDARGQECFVEQSMVFEKAPDQPEEEWVLPPGQHFLLTVHNNLAFGDRGVITPYVTLLDLLPTGEIVQHWPQESAEEGRLNPGQSLVIPICFWTDPIEGLETMRVFATSEPVDLRSLQTSSGRRTRSQGGLAELERLFSETFGGTRSGGGAIGRGTAGSAAVRIRVQSGG